MNICVLAPENSPSWGGVGAYTFNLLKNIPIKDGEIHVVTINREVEDSFDKVLNDRFIVHKIIDVDNNDSFVYNLKFQIEVFKQLKKLNNEYKFDIIHSHSGHIPHLFSQFQKIAPIVTTVHATVKGLRKGINKYQLKEDNTESLMKLFSFGIEQCEKIGFKKSTRLLPVSEFTSKQIKDDYGYNNPGKIKTTYNAVDTSLFYSDKKVEVEPTLLFVGRLYAIKGVDIFLDAIDILSKRGLKFKVLIAGRGDTEIVTKRLLCTLSKDKFEIKGRVSYFDMPKIYNRSDILVVTSIYENCPTNILEAMSSKTLVVAPNVGGIPEIINDKYNGLLFDTGNVLQLVDILTNVITKNIDTNKIIKNASVTVSEKFDWKQRGSEIFEIYNKVLNGE